VQRKAIENSLKCKPIAAQNEDKKILARLLQSTKRILRIVAGIDAGLAEAN
jgi:hypothetical protein